MHTMFRPSWAYSSSTPATATATGVGVGGCRPGCRRRLSTGTLSRYGGGAGVTVGTGVAVGGGAASAGCLTRTATMIAAITKDNEQDHGPARNIFLPALPPIHRCRRPSIRILEVMDTAPTPVVSRDHFIRAGIPGRPSGISRHGTSPSVVPTSLVSASSPIDRPVGQSIRSGTFTAPYGLDSRGYADAGLRSSPWENGFARGGWRPRHREDPHATTLPPCPLRWSEGERICSAEDSFGPLPC